MNSRTIPEKGSKLPVLVLHNIIPRCVFEVQHIYRIIGKIPNTEVPYNTALDSRISWSELVQVFRSVFSSSVCNIADFSLCYCELKSFCIWIPRHASPFNWKIIKLIMNLTLNLINRMSASHKLKCQILIWQLCLLKLGRSGKLKKLIDFDN